MSDIEVIEQAPTIYVVGKSSIDITEVNRYLESIGATWNQRGVQAPYFITMPEGVTHEELQQAAEWLNNEYVGTENQHKPLIMSHPDIKIHANPLEANDFQLIAEFGGRVCYGSWHNPAGRSTNEYLQEQIVAHRHESVIESLVFNCAVQNLPRSSQLELVRHRVGCAYSFESTRFTDKRLRFVVPPALRGDEWGTIRWKGAIKESVVAYRAVLEKIDVSQESGTLKSKRAKEAARSLLPNSQGSDGLFTVNARAARHIMQLRSSEHADQSIREFAVALYDALAPLAPGVFGDLMKREHFSGVPEIVPVHGESEAHAISESDAFTEAIEAAA